MLLTDNLFYSSEMQGVVACWENIDQLYTDKWNFIYNSWVAHLSPIKTEEHGHAQEILINTPGLLIVCWPKRLWTNLLDKRKSSLLSLQKSLSGSLFGGITTFWPLTSHISHYIFPTSPPYNVFGQFPSLSGSFLPLSPACICTASSSYLN